MGLYHGHAQVDAAQSGAGLQHAATTPTAPHTYHGAVVDAHAPVPYGFDMSFLHRETEDLRDELARMRRRLNEVEND